MFYACFRTGGNHYFGCMDPEKGQALGIAPWNHGAPEQVNALIGQCHESAPEPGRAGSWPMSQVQLLAPVPAPGKILCIGRNYPEHASEMGAKVEDIPVVFNKFPSCVIAHEEPVVAPEMSTALDYEAELVVVIGRKVRNLPAGKVAESVFGFCCGNDVTARDWQKGKPGGQWLLGKSFDTFAPLGPWIAPARDLYGRSLEITMHVNGELRQSASTGELIFPVEYLVSHLSRFCTLYPGDLIFTGTPSGVGAGRQPPAFLKRGDIMTVTISGIGTLRNPVA